jgi:surfeit locus 1 family protein
MISFRPTLWSTVFTGLALVWILWLGVWQLDRLAWKLDLMAASQARSTGAALKIETALSEAASLEEARFRRVTASGIFDHKREVLLYWPAPKGTGYKVITPLIREGAPAILVDRGFIPEHLKDPATRVSGQIEGSVEVTGIIRLVGQGTWGVSSRLSSEAIWTWRDLDGMARWMSLKAPVPVFIQTLPTGTNLVSGGWPRPSEPEFVFTNNHLSYALTWFGLAFALISVYIAFHASQGRLSVKRRKTR